MQPSIFLLLSFFLLFVGSGTTAAQKVAVDAQSAARYVLAHQKSNGAFGPAGMDYTDLAWTYPAVHALKLLSIDIPDADSCYKNGHKPWIEKEPWKNGPWYWSLHQKANLYKLMDKKGDLEPEMAPGVNLKLQFKPRTNYTEFRDYVNGKFYDMSSLWSVVEALAILDGTVSNPGFIGDFILSRQTEQGGFEDLLDGHKTPRNEKAHVTVTHSAVMTLLALGIPVPNKGKVITWLQSLQSSDGGFRWNPEATSPANQSDVWYTWAAVATLDALGAEPGKVEACLGWLNMLQNADGGFGDRPGWQSRLYSTYYAVHTIDILSGDARQGITPKALDIKQDDLIPEGEYAIFQAHHKSPGGGKEMVDAVAEMGLNLIAVKTSEQALYQNENNGMSDMVRAAREYAQEKGYPLEIVDAPENYSHRLIWFSGMKGNHVANYMIPPDISDAQWQAIRSAHKVGTKELPWERYKEEVIDPVLGMGTLFYPELDYTMANAYIVYDEGLKGDKSYNAVPAAHFGNYDWVRHFPYKERWLGQLPMIADGDAHGDIHQWRDNLLSYRNVFIAKDYTYRDYIDASYNNRSVCVIRMPSGFVRYYGSRAAVTYLKKHKEKWQWWE